MYYWYYGTLAMFQMGGENWERWNKNLKTVVIDHQHGTRTAASKEAGTRRIPGARKAAGSTRRRS